MTNSSANDVVLTAEQTAVVRDIRDAPARTLRTKTRVLVGGYVLETIDLLSSEDIGCEMYLDGPSTVTKRRASGRPYAGRLQNYGAAVDRAFEPPPLPMEHRMTESNILPPELPPLDLYEQGRTDMRVQLVEMIRHRAGLQRAQGHDDRARVLDEVAGDIERGMHE